MGVVLHGGAPAAARAAPPAAYSSAWRQPTNQPLVLGSDDQPAALRHPGPPTPRLDSRWRMGSDAPLAPSSHGRTSVTAEANEVNRSNWRLGDPQAFRMDGSDAGARVLPSAALAASEWRLGDARPFHLDGREAPPRSGGATPHGGAACMGMPPAACTAEARERHEARPSVREARLRHETEELRKNIGAVPPLGDHAQRMRRGEFRF